ncbi:DUF1090 family protein [Hafnia psychrotolerans]|uniref:DUF1090 domain-containing protein n=1 Tax=Hafnia psychrotolerans TaxID=1477018 RepID=A0ABQ1G9H3_9GAMM|nr:DUF1090 family protein [Hafnia psychrotolerans]GGA39328.1 hypothetical protein GCM10011328_12810 [Hafnia psychrotolerans]
MKKAFLSVVLFGFVFSSYAATNSCAERKADITQKIEAAEASGNVYAERGLKRALSDVNTYCNDSQQRKRAEQQVSQKEQRLRNAEHDLQSAENELDEAKAQGRSSKIDQKRHKVEEKKFKLKAARDALQQAQNDAKRLNKY